MRYANNIFAIKFQPQFDLNIYMETEKYSEFWLDVKKLDVYLILLFIYKKNYVSFLVQTT